MLTPTEEIKSRLDIVEVVREYVSQLKQAGTNWKANCPFHAEKTPSFMVSQEKQIWHCFGCGEGGDIFSFVQKIEGVEFVEALRILARKAGVVLRKQDPQLVNQKNRLIEVCELTASVYHKILLESPKAEKAREYLKERELSNETIEDFRLGYAPDSWEALSRFLLDKGFTENELFLAGLVVKKEGRGGFYDRFRNRIVFPIFDVHGSIVGFTARQMPGVEDKMGKYVNTPQTAIYDKSRIIYGLDKAKKSIRENSLVVVVEGNMDVIASHQAGIKNVVASSGTALTNDQINLLKRYSNNIALSFDMDQAGEAAAKRGIDNALKTGMNIKVIQIPEELGKDPDDCIRKDPKAWQEVIGQAQSFMQYYFNKTLEGLNLEEVDDKKKAAQVLLTIISKIPDKVEQTHWLQKLANLISVSEQILREQIIQSVNRLKRDEVKETKVDSKPKPDQNTMLCQRLFALVLKYPDNLKYVIEHLLPEMVFGDCLKKFYKELIIYYNKEGFEVIDDFKAWLKEKGEDKNLIDRVDILSLLADKDLVDFSQEMSEEEVSKIIKVLKRNYILRELKKIENQIKEFEDSKFSDKDKIKELSKEFNRLTEQLSQVN